MAKRIEISFLFIFVYFFQHPKKLGFEVTISHSQFGKICVLNERASKE
jgi:hypothetical protein